MFKAWREARTLAAIAVRDAEVGIPTDNTLHKRLEKAALKGMWGVVDDCLQKGADVNSKVYCETKLFTGRFLWPLFKFSRGDVSAAIPLISIAIMRKEWKAAENLLAQGADPGKTFVAGGSKFLKTYAPLDIAVSYNNPAMVQKLCDSGAHLWPSSLCLAEERGYNDIIKIMRAAEAKRAGAAAAPKPAPATVEEKIIGDLEKLSPAAREKLLAAVNAKFARPKPAEDGLAQDVVVSKPLVLKKQS